MFLADFVKRWQTQLYRKGSWLQKTRPILLLMKIRNGKRQQILTWNPQLEDGFIFVKRDFLPTRDETLGKLQNIMEARGFRAMSYSGFTQYVHFFNPDTKANPPAELADSESDEDLTSSQKRERKKKAPRRNNEL